MRAQQILVQKPNAQGIGLAQRALAQFKITGHQAKQRRLARSVQTDQSDFFTGLDVPIGISVQIPTRKFKGKVDQG